MAERVQVRDLTNDEGRKLLSIIRRGSGSVVRWRRAQIVLWSAQRMDVPAIAKIAFTSEDRVRAVIHNFNDDGFDSLAPRYAGGRPPTFTLPQRREIKKVALSRPTDHDLPFSTWSLSKLAEFLVAEGVVDDISHEGLRALLREEGVSFQVIKTFKQSNDPDFEAKKNRVIELYDIALRSTLSHHPRSEPLHASKDVKGLSCGVNGHEQRWATGCVTILPPGPARLKERHPTVQQTRRSVGQTGWTRHCPLTTKRATPTTAYSLPFGAPPCARCRGLLERVDG